MNPPLYTLRLVYTPYPLPLKAAVPSAMKAKGNNANRGPFTTLHLHGTSIEVTPLYTKTPP